MKCNWCKEYDIDCPTEQVYLAMTFKYLEYLVKCALCISPPESFFLLVKNSKRSFVKRDFALFLDLNVGWNNRIYILDTKCIIENFLNGTLFILYTALQ